MSPPPSSVIPGRKISRQITFLKVISSYCPPPSLPTPMSPPPSSVIPRRKRSRQITLQGIRESMREQVGGEEAQERILNNEASNVFNGREMSSVMRKEKKARKESEAETHAVLSQAESSSTVLPLLQALLDELEDSDMDDDATVKQNHIENNVVAKKNNKREKRKAKEERELEVRAAEERILQKDIPQTEEEFEKLVRSSLNDSFVWVQYMAYMVSLADVEKARSIAERALRMINFREEKEKLNIWTAYFNLENQYGKPPEEAVRKIFQRALQYCDPKRVHMALLGVYERTEQHKLGDELLERMTKKFRTSCKIWLHRVQSLLKQGKDGIQSVVNHALLSLPPKKRIKFISQTAILEFKCGVPDRGRSMFEGILREYPKRTDLWSVYLDQEIHLGDSEVIRSLFERVTCLSLPSRKIKSLFEKYLNYEKSQGDEERVEHVRRKAMEYAESLK